MNEVLVIAKALSEPSRVRVLMCLSHRVLCAGQIAEILDLAPSTVSKHMGILVDAGLTETWSEGRWRYYRLAEEGMTPLSRQMVLSMQQSLAETAEAEADLRRMEQVCARSDAPVPERVGRRDSTKAWVSRSSR